MNKYRVVLKINTVSRCCKTVAVRDSNHNCKLLGRCTYSLYLVTESDVGGGLHPEKNSGSGASQCDTTWI